MANFKPLLMTFLSILVIGLFLNVFVSPFVDTSVPVSGSVLEGFIDFIDYGMSIDLPVLGSLTFSPVSWLWLGINPVTDFIVEQLTIMTYIPDSIALIILVLSILALAFSVVTLIRGN